MIQLYDGGAYVLNGTEIIADTVESASILAGKLGSVPEKEEAKKQTIAYGILKATSFSFWEYIACRIEILAITCYFFLAKSAIRCV